MEKPKRAAAVSSTLKAVTRPVPKRAVRRLLLYREAREQGLPGLTRLAAPLSALALAGLVWVYSCNCLVYHQRLSYAREQAAAGAESITLPLLPYDQWAINETVWKGDISYLVYREVPWDVAFTFVPWAEYTAP